MSTTFTNMGSYMHAVDTCSSIHIQRTVHGRVGGLVCLLAEVGENYKNACVTLCL